MICPIASPYFSKGAVLGLLQCTYWSALQLVPPAENREYVQADYNGASLTRQY
ncbi:hypothetical protein SAMN06269173_103360 [Hymenobacter mucosus]|uniref:Uncharacterized protein n=1 Tax=Hymenobacter mucosus TaxID=1411120 RepID=A0A238X1U6_9BACT|nr:hypothetical protein SAMN06269173_103360 [Hymenobacter mucosus]